MVGQVQRCYNPKYRSYRWYGAKGIRVMYTRRDFVSWWLFHIKDFKGKRPSISRLDHSKNYTFSNIKIEELRDNCVEGVLRTGKSHLHAKRRPIKKVCFHTGETLARYTHSAAAGRAHGVTQENIYAQAQYPKRKKWGKKTGFRFEFDD